LAEHIRAPHPDQENAALDETGYYVLVERDADDDRCGDDQYGERKRGEAVRKPQTTAI
jgi:hypothetical protein